MPLVKRLSLAFLSCFLLAASCTDSKSVSGARCDQQFWNGTFATCLPTGWKVLSQQDLALLGVPEETIAAFQREEAKAGQFDTISVTREPLPQVMSTTEYSDASILNVSRMPQYTLIDKSSVFIDGQQASLHVFSARAGGNEPMRRYYQVSAVSQGVGYVFTGSFPLSVADSEASEVLLVLRNISFMDPRAVKAE